MTRESVHTVRVLPLVELVRRQVDASGLSLRDYAADRGISYSTLRRYYDKHLEPLSQPPRRETLRTIALALDVPLGEVEQAALASLSYRQVAGRLESISTSTDPVVAYVEDTVAELSDEQKAAVLEAFRRAVRDVKACPPP